MLDFIPKVEEELEETLRRRGYDLSFAKEFFEAKKKRTDLQKEVDALRHKQNIIAKKFYLLDKENNIQEANKLKQEAERIKSKLKEEEKKLREADVEYKNLLLSLPNIVTEDAPHGYSDENNRVIRYWGEKPEFKFTPKPHWEIGENLGILDFHRAAKMSGSRFVVFREKGALLERALVNFMLDLHTKEHKYKEVLAPFMVKERSMKNTGQLPKFSGELFFCSPDFYLIPTAEVTLVNLHQDEILKEEDLPLLYVGYSPCFRAEAGSWGKDTRGMMRQHQFEKVELVQFTLPEYSAIALEEMTKHAEEVLRRLNLHYRVVELCAGNLGFSSYKTYDLEVWIPSESRYREISSCSNCLDFQAWRGNIRLKRKKSSKLEYPHTLNGSGLAVGRTFLAILENYQTETGAVKIPEALIPYMNGVDILC